LVGQSARADFPLLREAIGLAGVANVA